ncbi:MAG: L-seryl-tRNA(Sec) selenium transferase [Gemmataceae bacterium]|nr:L-seryl-tRNA(Sec) selenium transferase [Gemmata sp.]MDW8197585.1 L-seryl-tRNA(Sec) selenium transferase [Gemmataceae bacterium]
MNNPFRHLPSMTKLLEAPGLVAARQRYSQSLITATARAVLAARRAQLAAGASGRLDVDSLVADIVACLDAQSQPALRPVINATGIVLHTNLGRSPLPEEAARAAYEAARGYLNLELDLASGQRSNRQDPIRTELRRLTGAESATAVNNCAAATVMALRAVAAGREVIVSRGQLVEIGGSFRIPEVMATSGAILREVGTTNITRLSDYERAITPHTAALMRVHASNYRIRGYTRAVALEQLVELGHRHNLVVIDDAGSGQMIDLAPFGFPDEPLIPASVAAGADLVLFSGDKLLGGPQCGLIVGKAELIEKIEKDPLMRAFRLDKMTLAALEATLRLYRDPASALAAIPTLRMLTTPVVQLQARSEALAERLRAIPGLTVDVRDAVAYVGGGSLPDQAIATIVLAIGASRWSESTLATRLRTGNPAVMARIQEGQVWLDLRCVREEQEEELLAAVRQAVQEELHPANSPVR